ncbi:MAG: DUF2812 domain-containing protein [Oscillospiraceae bacterium]
MRLAKKFFPLSQYDVPAIESWLADAAEDGYFLVGMQAFVLFERKTPHPATYRLLPFSREQEVLDEEELALFAASGWRYICDFNRLFHIFVSLDETPAEPHTDPLAESYAYDYLEKKLRRTSLIALISSVLCLLLSSVYLFNDAPLYYFIINNAGVAQLPLLLSWGYSIWTAFRDMRSIRRLRESLCAGIPMTHETDYSAAITRTHLFLAADFLSLFLLFGCLLYGMQFPHTGRENQPPPAFLTLAELETPAFLPTPETDYRYAAWSLLVPVQWKLEQTGTVPGAVWADSDDSPYFPRLSIDYYELRFGFLARPFADDLATRSILWDTRITLEERTVPGFDTVLTCTEDASQRAICIRGNSVLYVSYLGYGSLFPQLPTFAEALAAQEETQAGT